MSETQVGQDPEVTAAIERLMSMELSSFKEILDATIKFRINALREKTGDGYTLRQALLGKFVNMRPVLLTETEIQILRNRGGYTYIINKRKRANSTIPIIEASLRRCKIADDLKTLGIKVESVKDRDRKVHIIFAPINR